MSANGELSNILSTLAAIMDIRGENTFKAIAFSKASRIIGDMTVDVRAAFEDGSLKMTPGIGPGILRIVQQYLTAGRSTDFDEAAASVPAGLLPMLAIPGLGPKTIALLWKERGVTDVESLVTAIADGKLAGLKGMGEKKIEAIKHGIQLQSQAAGRVGLPMAIDTAGALLARLRGLPQVRQAEAAGSLRRRRETIGDVDLVAAVDDMDAAADVTSAFVKFPETQHVNVEGPTKASILTAGGLQVDLRVVPTENFGAALLYFTGSKEHGVAIRGLALDKKMTLNEWGLYDLKQYDAAPERKPGTPPKLKSLASRTEADVYKTLGMAYVEPELREDRGEVQAAIAGTLPTLVTAADIRGDLHTHTTASDGNNSIEEMAEAAIARGYKFLAITDHSKSQVIANGLTAERLLRHVKAIRKAAEKYAKQITLLAGCEVDILVDGRLDFESAVLAELDIVVASPHVSLKQDAPKATDRILRAIDTRYVNIIGHPTGRLIDRRDGLPLDVGKVIAAAAKNSTALEINAGYPRLDLNDMNARAALRAGAMLSINTDAHATGELDAMGLGVGVARRAWASAEHVINCWTASRLQKFLAAKR